MRVMAIVTAVLAFFACLMGPFCLYAFALGLRPNDGVPNAGIWFVIAGGALGAGAAYLVFRSILTRYGRTSAVEVDSMWHGNNRKQ